MCFAIKYMGFVLLMSRHAYNHHDSEKEKEKASQALVQSLELIHGGVVSLFSQSGASLS